MYFSQISCITCGHPLVKINGRSLKDCIKRAGVIKPKPPQFKVTDSVALCVACYRNVLNSGSYNCPVLFPDGVYRIAEEYDVNTKQFLGNIINFGNLRFTQSALFCSMALINLNDPKKWRCELRGMCLRRRTPMRYAKQFSRAVCDWGRGRRVFANLVRYNNMNLDTELTQWLQSVSTATTERAIADGTRINGLGVSFASKHLRMLDPSRFAVLDDVISGSTGFAMNVAGYAFFIDSLEILQRSLSTTAHHAISSIEGGIFFMARQLYRSK